MTAGRCAQPIEFETLVAYWLGELPAAAEAAAEEHYFGCAYCARRLEGLAALGGGIRAAVREGKVWAFVTPSFVEHMKREGLRVREYRTNLGERVDCTIRADEDAVAGRMRVPLAGVKRLDILGTLEIEGRQIERWRSEDVPFEPGSDEVVTLPSAAALKKMPANTVRVQLFAVDEAGERLLGEVTFAHTPS
jgi:hypothetical protein